MPESNPDAQTPGEASQPPPSGGPQESPGEPPLTPPVFPQRPPQQVPEQEQQRPHVTFATPVSTPQAQWPQPSGLVNPVPGTLHRSPEDLTREVGWTALTEAVTASAQKLYPTDPKAVALTVANTLQPYMTAFSPARVGFEKNVSTSGNTPGTPMSKTTEGTWSVDRQKIHRGR